MQHALGSSTAGAHPCCAQRRAARSAKAVAVAAASSSNKPLNPLCRLRLDRHVAAPAVPSSSSSAASSSSSAADAAHPHVHGHEHAGGERARPGQKKGFVEEMRFVAMKLHTKDQAPKEGGREAAATPWAKWQPTREGYLKFLNESKKVYEALEEAVNSRDEYKPFRDTGLERSQALAEDVRWFRERYGLEPAETGDDGPGARYAARLRELAGRDPPAFICHFYNVYFAHTAGGRMIGVRMADMLLERHALEFYKYPLAPGGAGADHRPPLDEVRRSLDAVAETWTREDKDRCLAETEESFKMSGALLRSIAEPVEEGSAGAGAGA